MRRTSHAVLATPQLATVARYNRFPYQYRRKGLVERVAPDEKDPSYRRFSGRTGVQAGYLGQGISKLGFSLDLNYWRLGLDSDLDWLVEGKFVDAMYLGSTNGRIALIMRPRARLRVGGGAQYMIDGRTPGPGQGPREYAAGPNLSADLEIYPFRPLTLSGRVDAGTLYRAPSIRARATAGVVIEGFELYAGFEHRRIGAVVFQGPVGGVRYWF